MNCSTTVLTNIECAWRGGNGNQDLHYKPRRANTAKKWKIPAGWVNEAPMKFRVLRISQTGCEPSGIHSPRSHGKREEGRDPMEEREGRTEPLLNYYPFLAQIPSYKKILSHGFARLHSQCLTLHFQIKWGDPILQPPVGLPENFLLLQFCLGIARISLWEAA